MVPIFSHRTIVVVILFSLGLCGHIYAKPKALVHIGPHKTGSTHFQHFIYTNAHRLESEGYYYPINRKGEYFSIKSVSYIALDIWAANGGNITTVHDPLGNTITDLRLFLKSCSQKNRNVIISGEDFYNINRLSLSAVERELSAFNVTIVASFREPVNTLVSHVSELSHNNDFGPLAEYVPNWLNPHIEKFDMEISQYMNTFGVDKLHIVDFYGIGKMKKDQTEVFLCEIMGILCDFNFSDNMTKHENSRHPVVIYQTYYLFQHEATNRHHCSVVPGRIENIKSRVVNLLSQERIPPLKLDDFSEVCDKSAQEYTNLTAKYSKNWLYRNATANHEACLNCEVKELAVEQFEEHPYWKSWVLNTSKLLQNEGKFTGCAF